MQKQVTVVYPADSNRQQDKHMSIKVHVSPDDNDFAVCERIWRMMNRVDGSEIEQYLDHFQERSMMVGDQVMFDGKTYQVDMIGFRKVS